MYAIGLVLSQVFDVILAILELFVAIVLEKKKEFYAFNFKYSSVFTQKIFIR